MDVTTTALQTLGLLYELPFSAERWPEVLDGMARTIGANGALLFVVEPADSGLQLAASSSRYKPDHVEQYLQSLLAEPEARWLATLDALPPRSITTDEAIWPDRAAYDAMPSVRFMRELSLYHRVATRPCAHGGWKDALTLLFDDRRGGITAEESARLAALLPHIANAIGRQRPFQLLRERYRAVLSALDRLGIGVLLVAPRGEIVVANREGERILAADDGLRRDTHGRLVAHRAGTAARLATALRDVVATAQLDSTAGARAITIERRANAPAYVLELSPLRDAGDELGEAFVGALVTLIDPQQRELIAIDALADRYGLSRSERTVCRLLADGLPLVEIADRRNVSPQTIKTQARAIYAKTNTRNRSDLIRRAQSISPVLVDRDGKRVV